MTMKTIRLELARNPGIPDGDAACGYEIRAPLDSGRHIDLDAFRADRKACTVHRFWRGEDDARGALHHTRHGAWVLSYAPGEDDDEPLFKLDSHVVSPGEYVTIRERDGRSLVFRVASVT